MATTNLITLGGFKKLQEEYDFLRYTERLKIVAEMQEAAKDGDFSENAPYQYAKKRVSEIDARLKFLGERLAILKVVSIPANPISAAFGTWVSFEDEAGTAYCYQLLGPDEFDVPSGRISIDSPYGVALVGKRVDDEASIIRPAGRLNVVVTSITSARPTA